MRLIDADKFVEYMAEKCDPNAVLDPIILAVIRGAVKEQPTAYDVDKVVEQLEKEMQTSTSAKTEAIIGMCGASANHYAGKEYAYEIAIEIVKGGGVDGN